MKLSSSSVGTHWIASDSTATFPLRWDKGDVYIIESLQNGLISLRLISKTTRCHVQTMAVPEALFFKSFKRKSNASKKVFRKGLCFL